MKQINNIILSFLLLLPVAAVMAAPAVYYFFFYEDQGAGTTCDIDYDLDFIDAPLESVYYYVMDCSDSTDTIANDITDSTGLAQFDVTDTSLFNSQSGQSYTLKAVKDGYNTLVSRFYVPDSNTMSIVPMEMTTATECSTISVYSSFVDEYGQDESGVELQYRYLDIPEFYDCNSMWRGVPNRTFSVYSDENGEITLDIFYNSMIYISIPSRGYTKYMHVETPCTLGTNSNMR
jgi:hypothetical protein